MNKALFLDRDGILNLDKGYVYKWEELVWMDEVQAHPDRMVAP